MHALRDMIFRDVGQFGVLPPGTYRLATSTSASVARNTAYIRGTNAGGWLKSASITPTTSADAAPNPATTAVPSPSFPVRCTTFTR